MCSFGAHRVGCISSPVARALRSTLYEALPCAAHRRRSEGVTASCVVGGVVTHVVVVVADGGGCVLDSLWRD